MNRSPAVSGVGSDGGSERRMWLPRARGDERAAGGTEGGDVAERAGVPMSACCGSRRSRSIESVASNAKTGSPAIASVTAVEQLAALALVRSHSWGMSLRGDEHEEERRHDDHDARLRSALQRRDLDTSGETLRGTNAAGRAISRIHRGSGPRLHFVPFAAFVTNDIVCAAPASASTAARTSAPPPTCAMTVDPVTAASTSSSTPTKKAAASAPQTRRL